MNSALLCILLLVPDSGCAVRVQRIRRVEKVIVQQQIVPVFVPTYSVYYQPPPTVVQQVTYSAAQSYSAPVTQQYQAHQYQAQAVQAQTDCCLSIDQISIELRKLTIAVERLRAGNGSLVPADTPAGAVKSMVGAKCASCHAPGGKGAEAGLVLIEVDGKIPPFSVTERRRIKEMVLKGAMPKPPSPPLSEAERAAVLRELGVE